ncbi:MAG: DNA uptake protein ComE-like DNA-binding protein [Cognaticolwellia sp.]|jgi:DNA uptake protein ComE-like DNA-binding protein
MLRQLLPIASLALLFGTACSETPMPPVQPTADGPVVDVAPSEEEQTIIDEALSVVQADGDEQEVSGEPAPTVNLNIASKEQIQAGVPGIGDKMIHEFEEYRPYVSISQFRKQMGKYVDAPTIAQYERFVFVPVDPNACDAETMAQLPGVTPAKAESLIAKRPFVDRDTFLNALVEVVAEADYAGAKAMLAP